MFELIEHIDLCLNSSVFVLEKGRRNFIFVDHFECVNHLLKFNDANLTESLFFGYIFDQLDLWKVHFAAFWYSDVWNGTDRHYNRYYNLKWKQAITKSWTTYSSTWYSNLKSRIIH